MVSSVILCTNCNCCYEPEIDFHVLFAYCRDGYSEKCVMNNYFGIWLDAKISLEFNNKREEHPEKCR